MSAYEPQDRPQTAPGLPHAVAMGTSQGSAKDGIACTEGVHQCSFPMYVVKVSDFLEMEGPPEPHHVLKHKGLLHEWHPGMFVIFISHQWLGAGSPDPLGQQVSVLRHALQAFIDGSMKVEVDLMRTFGDVGGATGCESVAQGHLFLDWFAIPQLTERTKGVNDDSTVSDTARAVQSIPAYVESCDMFVALVPDLVHNDTGLQCNYSTWLSRGWLNCAPESVELSISFVPNNDFRGCYKTKAQRRWCRAELWCRLLSNRKDTSVVVIFSAREALYIVPLDWQKNLISDGLFTVERDRSIVVKLGETALRSKIEHLQRWGPLTDYRFHLAQEPRLLKRKQQGFEDLHSFLQHFDFNSLQAAVKHESGMTGMLCSMLAGDVGILQVLAENGGDVNARVSGLDHLGYSDSLTLLMVAAYVGQDPKVLSTLMTLRADPNLACISESGSIVTASWLASQPEHVQVLLEYRADFAMSPPLTGVAGVSSVNTVKAFLNARCDPGSLSPNGFGPMYSAPFFGRGNPDCHSIMQLLLSARGDVNAQAKPRGWFYWECMRARVSASLWGLEACSVYKRQMASLPGATPLSIAAVTGDQRLVKLLLENDAEHVPNDRGDKPEDLARAAGHTELLPILSTFCV